MKANTKEMKETDSTFYIRGLEIHWFLIFPFRVSTVLGMQYIFSGMHAKSLRHVPLFVTQWTVAHQTPLSTGFSRQEHWSGLPLPPSGPFSIMPTLTVDKNSYWL